MRPHGIDHLRQLPHQKIAPAVLHQPALLLGRLNLHKSHGGRRTASQIASASAVSLFKLTHDIFLTTTIA
jgi:hypothetical protein